MLLALLAGHPPPLRELPAEVLGIVIALLGFAALLLAIRLRKR